MRKVDAALETHLALSVRTMAACWLIEMVDGTYEAYTSHDTDLTFGGYTFVRRGVSQTNTSSKMEIETDNLELHGIIDPLASFATVNSRKYDDARVKVFEVDYTNLPDQITTSSVLWIKIGVIGDAFYERGKWVMEARGFKQLLKQTTGNKTSRLCRAEFGDENCRADLTLYSHAGVVTAYSGKTLVTDITAMEANAAKQGKVTFTANDVAYDIVSSTGGSINLIEDVDFDPVGMSVLVVQGCNKWLDDCEKYTNAVNYYGEPYVPTEDEWAAGYFSTIIG
ncbi:hypothetical protein vBAcoSR7M_38 [Alteromonas phage vB_AcoS-R7M]|uniref:Bacteriophage phiJL001 Gp84 C-terminal domain-containing protein n=1 Tax=Alteromonas phage vB_AcoS-R7M TaxID=2729541 RepID=A0A6M3YNG1_9CAUD|nr:tail assembly protein [Alteromonas phage vB_AcoS-R7M]QJI53360.1 hypothetical protein vBAcoSR7M_38 [Alteromonas phage vB_AcoS-R7M]